MLSSFAQLRQQLHQSGPRSAVVAAAQDEHTLQAVLAARRDGLSVETAARNERYGCFARLAQSENCLVATAHTASDQAETVLFRLARGTGLRGLCGIPAKRGPFIRPLLCVTRQQVEAYVGELGLPFVTDSTNLSDVYTRNRLRHQVIPQLWLM